MRSKKEWEGWLLLPEPLGDNRVSHVGQRYEMPPVNNQKENESFDLTRTCHFFMGIVYMCFGWRTWSFSWRILLTDIVNMCFGWRTWCFGWRILLIDMVYVVFWLAYSFDGDGVCGVLVGALGVLVGVLF